MLYGRMGQLEGSWRGCWASLDLLQLLAPSWPCSDFC